jgi:hypothetical protein
VVRLVIIFSLLLAFFPGGVATPNPAASSTSPICQLQSGVHDAVFGQKDCGLSGEATGCFSHSVCFAITIPAACGLAAAGNPADWTFAEADDPAGQGPPVGTPPPIPAA